MKIRPVTAEFSHADGWMHITKLTATYRTLAKAPNKCSLPGRQNCVTNKHAAPDASLGPSHKAGNASCAQSGTRQPNGSAFIAQ